MFVSVYRAKSSISGMFNIDRVYKIYLGERTIYFYRNVIDDTFALKLKINYFFLPKIQVWLFTSRNSSNDFNVCSSGDSKTMLASKVNKRSIKCHLRGIVCPST